MSKLAATAVLTWGVWHGTGFNDSATAQQPIEPPRLFPQSQVEARAITQAQGTAEPLSPAQFVRPPQRPNAGRATQSRQPQQQQYVDPVEKPNPLQRLFGGFKNSRVPEAPPEDPGMNYPKASEQRTANTPQRTASAGNELLIPPGWTAGVPAASPPTLSPVPVNNELKLFLNNDSSSSSTAANSGLLTPPALNGTSTNPPELTLTAPPVADSAMSLTPPGFQTTPALTIAPEPASELTLTPPGPFSDSSLQIPTAETRTGLLPPAATPMLELPAPSTPATAPALELPALPELPQPAGALPMITSAAPIPTLPASPTEPTLDLPADDPLGNAFPEDQTESTAQNAEPIEQPYTGLKLEEGMFQRPLAPAAVPAAQPVPAPVAPAAEAEDDLRPTLPPISLAPLSAPAAVTAAPALPQAGEAKPSLPAESIREKPVDPGRTATVRMVDSSRSESEPNFVAPRPAPIEVATAPQPQSPPARLPGLSAPGQPTLPAPSADVQSKASIDPKMAKIKARADRPGLKGFCPVVLRDNRDLQDAQEEFSALFNGKIYSFSSEAALEKFLDDPVRYAPAARGNDVIHQALTGEELEGSLEFAVWYQGRLYLFASVETLETFTAAPSSHSTQD